mmetsp:Transcript_68147/g.154175  ORF Transcript_68147/g.154175 Transcript_68147/m.154175 type:complete len:180 (+) Transcript_68147:237-776(+)|eukprot:CAMPEP_0172622502 /NCGR_PEP_ID=MMETSP1068-20121228/120947_1 /TAXON_ID=35684 /ORGANISM="Pseudopedinella elastica, Strain CCMP716" /LENGTH=179 /DNA_ID=CAMNT_0013430685 /DNA_START=147 /DNA_END=686 /DNA_ORIENTATION=-
MDFTNRSQQIAAGSQDEASRISDLIVSEVIEIMMIDDIFELHRSAKTGNLSLVDDFLVVTRETTVNGSHVVQKMNTDVVCVVCGHAVGAAKYASHLDKCMLGKSRAATGVGRRLGHHALDQRSQPSRGTAEAQSIPPPSAHGAYPSSKAKESAPQGAASRPRKQQKKQASPKNEAPEAG